MFKTETAQMMLLAQTRHLLAAPFLAVGRRFQPAKKDAEEGMERQGDLKRGRMGRVEAVCKGEHLHTGKHPVDVIHLEEGWGVAGDAHAGIWHRQVSLFDAGTLEGLRHRCPELTSGSLSENILCRGVDFSRLAVGDLLVIDDTVVLEITELGMECEHPCCRIKEETGCCAAATEGAFARVVAGGEVRPDSRIQVRRCGHSPS